MSDSDYTFYMQLIYSILGGCFLRETFYLYFPLSFSPETSGKILGPMDESGVHRMEPQMIPGSGLYSYPMDTNNGC